MRLVVLQQPLGEGGQAKEVGFLFGPFHRRAQRLAPYTIRTDHRLLLIEVGLLAHRIPARILVEINVAGLLHAPPDFFRGAVVPGFGGANKVILADVERNHQVAEVLRIAVSQRLRRQPLGERCLLHFETVLVGAGEEEHILVVEAFKARDGIRGKRRIGVADVWHAVRIEDRCGDVELLFPAHIAGSALG